MAEKGLDDAEVMEWIKLYKERKTLCNMALKEKPKKVSLDSVQLSPEEEQLVRGTTDYKQLAEEAMALAARVQILHVAAQQKAVAFHQRFDKAVEKKDQLIKQIIEKD